MSRKSTWIQYLIAQCLPILYGCTAAMLALGGLFLAIVFAGKESLSAASPIQVQNQMLMARKLPPAQPASMVSPAPVVTPPSPIKADQGPTPTPPAPIVAKPVPSPAKNQATPHVNVKAEPWQWTVFRDDVIQRFRTELPELGGLPLLHYAVLLDDAEWVNDLLAQGADPNEPTPGGDTILSTAVRLGSVNCARALLHAGADVTKPGYEKQPPLALASLRRGPDMLRALMSAGADPNTRFTTPVSKALLDRVTIKDLMNALEEDRGITPLIACASRGDVEGAAELLRAGASPAKCTTRYHRYPINFAATQGYLFLMRIILGRQPESEPEVLVTVDLSKQRAWVMKEGQIIDSCSVSTGREGYNTPAGRYVITDKHRSWTSTLYHVAMPYFMRLNCGAIGLHSGYVTGRPASHGCIRLPYEKAQKFFGLCRVGDEVQIVH